MPRVHVTETTEVILNGKIKVIPPNVYEVSNIGFCKENDYTKCHKCKEWFDLTCELSRFHPKCNGKDYCEPCFNKLHPNLM